jgi:hypothetical protein
MTDAALERECQSVEPRPSLQALQPSRCVYLCAKACLTAWAATAWTMAVIGVIGGGFWYFDLRERFSRLYRGTGVPAHSACMQRLKLQLRGAARGRAPSTSALPPTHPSRTR